MKKIFEAFSSLEIRDMTIRMKRREKIIAIILLVAMCLSMVPYQALAKTDYESSTIEQVEEINDEHVYNVDVDPKDIPIISEDISKRTANEKHFRKADGSYEVAIYDTNVHYKDGYEWKDIDNSLVSTTKDGSYHNRANQFDINFPKDISKQDIKVTMDEYQVSWKLVGSKASTLVKDDSEKIKTSELDLRELINISKQVKYSEVIKGVDLVYNLNGTKIKEEIVLDAYQSGLSFNFEYNLKGLSFEQTDENIVLVNEINEIVFVFDPLLMFDDKGNESSDIEYKIEETGKNTYIFSVIPNDAWLQDAAYPVTIDPTIDSSSGMGIFDTYISECYPSSYYSSTKMVIGDDGSNGEFRGLLYFSLPSELEDQMITYASLGFVKQSVTEDA